MAENLAIAVSEKKEERYKTLLPQIESLVSGEPDLIANLSNIAAALKQTFDFFWVGFYLVKENELVLGPFQGPIACTRIGSGKGVLRFKLERKENHRCSQRRRIPWTYCVQFRFKIRDCSAGV